MKLNIFLIFLFFVPFISQSQDIEQLNKKELRVEYYSLRKKNDSLISLIDNQKKNIEIQKTSIEYFTKQISLKADTITILKKRIFEISEVVSLDNTLLGKSKEEIKKMLKSKNGIFRVNFDSLRFDMIAFQVNSLDTVIECYYFNEYNIAFSICHNVFSNGKMMKQIKYFNENYIKGDDLNWTYYFRNQKLSVSLQGNENGKLYSVYFTNLTLGDFQKCKKKLWLKPTQADIKNEWKTFVLENKKENLLPYFFKSDFDNNGQVDEAWILYSDDLQSMGVFAYMNNNKIPIEIYTFKFSYNSAIYVLPIGKHQVYYKYNAISDYENDIHEVISKTKGIEFSSDFGDFYLFENGKFERYAYSNY
jgi:hypothetical protein